MATVDEGPEERGFGQAVTLGIILGIPGLYLISLLIALPGAGWPAAAGIATVPAMFGGPLFGGFAMVLREVARREREEKAASHTAHATPSDDHRLAA